MRTDRQILRSMIALQSIIEDKEPVRMCRHPERPEFVLIATSRGIIVKRQPQGGADEIFGSLKTTNEPEG